MTDTTLDLPHILEQHRLWLRGEGGARANLIGANLIGAILSGANLIGANLSDANLSRANLIDANLSRANLIGANLIGANLSDANLGGANLGGANLIGANLSDAKWTSEITISRTPLQLYGLAYPVTILDQHIQIGCQLHSTAEWDAFDDEAIAKMDGCAARRFWKEHKAAIIALATSGGRGELVS